MPFRDLYRMTKPGLVYGNLIPVIGGYVLGAGGRLDAAPFAATLAGMAAIMGSSCVLNNVIDADIDLRMRRTHDRAVPAGRVSRGAAAAFGAAVGLTGFALLAWGANPASVLIAAVGYAFYVLLYSVWWKRRSPLGTAVGSVAGAVPPVVGYVAASGQVDIAAGVLFATLIAWQMPHFFAVAIRHAADYAAAGVPVLPVARGIGATKTQMLAYVTAYVLVAPLLTAFGYSGIAYLVATLTLGLCWLALAVRGARIPENDTAATLAWARRMFLLSLLVLMVPFSVMAVEAVIRGAA